jgi:hypothetical protein
MIIFFANLTSAGVHFPPNLSAMSMPIKGKAEAKPGECRGEER